MNGNSKPKLTPSDTVKPRLRAERDASLKDKIAEIAAVDDTFKYDLHRPSAQKATSSTYDQLQRDRRRLSAGRRPSGGGSSSDYDDDADDDDDADESLVDRILLEREEEANMKVRVQKALRVKRDHVHRKSIAPGELIPLRSMGTSVG